MRNHGTCVMYKCVMYSCAVIPSPGNGEAVCSCITVTTPHCCLLTVSLWATLPSSSFHSVCLCLFHSLPLLLLNTPFFPFPHFIVFLSIFQVSVNISPFLPLSLPCFLHVNLVLQSPPRPSLSTRGCHWRLMAMWEGSSAGTCFTVFLICVYTYLNVCMCASLAVQYCQRVVIISNPLYHILSSCPAAACRKPQWIAAYSPASTDYSIGNHVSQRLCCLRNLIRISLFNDFFLLQQCVCLLLLPCVSTSMSYMSSLPLLLFLTVWVIPTNTYTKVF